MKAQKKNQNDLIQEPSLKASRIRAYVDPILKLLIASIINDNLERLENIDNRIINSIIKTNIIDKNIVFTDLSSKKEIKLLVK